MKLLAVVVCIPLFVSANPSETSSTNSSYDIAAIYEKVELKDGAKVLDSYGNIEDAEAVLVPTKINAGKYEVELTRVDSDFYQICGTSLYIETRSCYVYAIRDEAILNITSNYSYTHGEVFFSE